MGKGREDKEQFENKRADVSKLCLVLSFFLFACPFTAVLGSLSASRTNELRQKN